MALILVMGTYGAGYVARIVGAFIFGKMGDRIGRKKVLFITITMMGICTTLIGVLPTYAQIGVFAPILLVTLRIIQGLGAGAEISGAGTMLVEYAPKGKRGIISSFVAMGTNCGTLSATAIRAFMFFILSKEELLAWGWRIPFLASVVVMVFAIWLRMNLKESPVFEKVNDSNQPTAKPAPAGSMFQSKSFWLATGLRFGQAGNSGLIQTFLAGYLVQTLLFNKAIPTDALMISSILGFMTIPFLGWLSDKIGRRIPYIIMNTSAIVLAWPMLSIIVDKSYAPSTIMVALIVIHNCAVLGFTVAEMSADAWTARVVGVVKKALHVQIDGLETVLAAMCEPQIAIVSLTITEKGYFHSPATGQLMLDHPMVVADVQNPHQPKTATGVIVEALARRKAAGLPAFTVMSCDNMPENGHVMRDVVTSYAQAIDVKLAQWIEDNVTFPSTMVDRIVPAVTEDTLAKIEQLTGVRDAAGVACEPFRQWVIEDNFVAGRPEWEKAGAELVSDVLPYEEMKLRMLNGSHSFLAYLGYLAGYQHINDCMEDEHYRHAAYTLMLQEQAPTLKVQGVDLQDYANRLIERYSNPALRHRTWQIAMDGSQKLPQRMLDSVRWHLAHDSKFDLLALGVAGWMRYVGGVDEQGNPIEISDPLLPVIQKAVQSSAEGTARVQSLLAIKAIFGDDLPGNSLFTTKVTEAYLSLLAHGAKATVAKYSVK
ncbi:MFS transporter [Escherichia coli]|nr:MFS transporter [Escherichia coli]